jgi:N-acetyl-anhydromuramyl-L-alanine amidase AmpD
MDAQHVGWHAGSRKINAKSIGVEISNAYDLKWQQWYKKNGFGERPIVDDAWVHGNKLKSHLGFYPVQLEALQALWEAVHNACGIPLETPTGSAKNAYTADVSSGRFKGFVSHYHITKRKIDCGGSTLDIEKLLEDLK